jgi:hypothetical protein
MLRTLIEMDFYGSAGNEKTTNSHNLRMRHAYVTLGGLTVGQANSAFMGSGAPDTFHAPLDDILIRQPLIRWTQPLGDGNVDISIEQPESVLDTNESTQMVPNDDQLPDLILKYVQYGSWGEVSLAAMARQLRADSDSISGKSDARIGSAFHLSGRIKTVGVDDLRFGIASGNGLGRYIGAVSALYAGGSIDESGTITLQTTTGAHLAYCHWWSEKLRSTAAYGHVVTQNNSGVFTATDKRADSTHLNLVWNPILNGMMGVEYIRANRELENGERYGLDRVQVVASYDF